MVFTRRNEVFEIKSLLSFVKAQLLRVLTILINPIIVKTKYILD